jgi:hypothetical protein
VVECRRWLVAHDAVSGIAQEGRIQNWLARLLGGMPGNNTADDVRMKMGAFVFALNDKPSYCFDDATLKIAMRRFKFWPSSAELMAFADEMEQWTRTTAKRAYKVVDSGPRTADRPLNRRPWAEGGAEDHAKYLREKQDRDRKELAAMVEARYGKPPPAPARLPGEDEKAYVARLCRHMNAELDQATKQMKGGLRARPKGSDKPAPPPTPEAMKAAYDTTGIKAKDVRDEQPAEAAS